VLSSLDHVSEINTMLCYVMLKHLYYKVVRHLSHLQHKTMSIEGNYILRVQWPSEWRQFSTSLNRFADSEVELRRVGCDCVNVPVGSRDPVYNFCAVDLLRLVTSNNIMTSLLEKVTNVDQSHVVKTMWSLFGQFPYWRPNPSAVVLSDSTRQLSRVGGVYWA